MGEINIENHMGLVVDTIRKTFKGLDNAEAIARKNHMEYEDLIQAGSIGLWKAAEKFDSSRGLEFSTYAAPYIRGYILIELDRKSLIKVSKYHYNSKQRQAIKNSVFSIHKQTGENEDDTFENTLMDEYIFEDQVIANIQIAEYLSVLNEKQKTIVLGRINGLSFKQIAEQVDSNNKACEKSYSRAIKKMKECFA
jgi:RNA polymerase sigma factor (sigma-70 family)